MNVFADLVGRLRDRTNRLAPRKTALAGVALTILCTASFLYFRQLRERERDIVYQPARAPLPAATGVDAAVEQTRRVVALLREVDWDPFKVSFSEVRLPDARLSARETFHDPKQWSYAFPNGVGENKAGGDPAYRDIACFTPIYVRTNPTYYKGGGFTFKPEGSYIVGWKDGRVTTIPVQDVRWGKGEKSKTVLSFPSMSNYNPSALRPYYVEFADGKVTPERARAYTAAVVDPEVCPTCKDPE